MMNMVRGRQIWGFLFTVTIVALLRIGEAQSKSYFINCGSSSAFTINGRKWVGDLAPDANLTLSSPGVGVNTTTLSGNSTFELVYKSAMVFSGELNYTFEGVHGNYIVRLHFCPFSFVDYDVNKSSFGVSANGLQLISEFNVPGKIADINLNMQRSDGNSSSSFSLVKEYILAINTNDFVIKFSPTKGSFGFINAIEIVPILDKLFPDSVGKVGGGEATLNGRGIETMYRLNVGGNEIKPNQDSDLWRTWEVDYSYMVTANAGSEISGSNITYVSVNDSSIAPLQVYETARTMSNTQVLDKRFNMSWKFKVDPDFDYLIRLHFCELVYDKTSQRIFRIFINNRTAANGLDIFAKAGGMNVAYHQDYFDALTSKIRTLWVQLGPDTATGASVTDAILNGLEIFKLSRNGNLAYVEKFDSIENSSTNSKTRMLWVGVGVGVASVVIFTIACILVCCFCKNGKNKSRDTKNTSPGWRPLFLHVNSTPNVKGSTTYHNANGSMASVRLGKQFTLAEIRSATNNFDESLVIGVGGFGKVYKGETEDGTLTAIKRSNPQSQQGLAEFETEIEMLSKLRHRHLVSLIGFCDEQSEMILVYEYMANGTLRNHLFGSDVITPLTWKQRLEACIGSARGLHYLHTGAERGIIHRDVKTTNILLDENFVAKMSDFGLSKDGPALDNTHVSTAVKGSFGYLDPEYFRRQHLTEKSDVYSFGVVLFEVVCARPVINPTLPKDQINLAEWAMRWQRERSLETIIDPRLKGKYSPESLEKFGEIAEKCLADEGKSRPTMGEVLWHLEFILQLHEAWASDQTGDSPRSSSHSIMEEGKAEAEAEGGQSVTMSSSR